MIIQEFCSKMHGFDYSIPHFITRVRGMRIVVTLDLIFEALHILRVKFANYSGYDRIWTVSKDELSSFFCGTPSSSSDRQNIACSGFTKGSRFLNMVMTFILYPLSRYNSITEFHARFLLSLLEGLTFDFPSHFILSLIDVYRDTVTCDKLISPSAITRIFRHFSVSYPESTHFLVMCAINTAIIKQSEAQLPPKQPRTEMVTPPTSFATPSSSTGGVTLEVIMA